MKILLDISFLGSCYCGYQVQPNLPTIQGQLNNATRALFGFDCDIVGCSRTDSGVHANHFCVTVSEKGNDGIQTNIPCEKLVGALSVYLPPDISVNSATLVSNEFHARYDVKYKEYEYLIWNSKIRNPFLHDRTWQYSKPIDDISLMNMQTAAKHFCGTQDFSAYMASDSNVKSTIRTIYSADVYRNGDIIGFKVSADGFLYNMVRILMGTLVSVAEGKISPDEIDNITLSKNRSRAGITVPPHGLYLNRVVY